MTWFRCSTEMFISLASSSMSFGSVGNELVQGRIEEADRDRAALHGLVDGLKVALLDRLELGQRLFALLDRLGDDHLAHRA